MSEAVHIPRLGWDLRDYQRPAWNAMAVQRRNACIVMHRRGGKDELALNAIGVQAMKRPASYAYMFPENLHARRAMWQAVNPHTGRRRVLETFPAEMLSAAPNETEMRLSLVNGSTITFFGSDNYDRMVGASLAGIISSEHALSHPSAYGFFSPMLRENGGFFWAISTPRGRNHFYTMHQMAQKSPDWFSQSLSIHDTGALTAAQIAEARQEYVDLYGIDQGEALFAQEYEVSFTAATLGAFYAREMSAVRAEGRVVAGLDAIHGHPVHRAWDLGVRDDTCIWFFQVVGAQLFILDCYSTSGVGLDHYRDEIAARHEENGWTHGTDFVPHDAKVKELGTGRTRVETMGSLGLNPQLVPNAGLLDGINALRLTLPRCVFSDKCEYGISALELYRREYDEEKRTFRANPLHDWTSHYADAARYMALAWREVKPEVRHVDPAPPQGMIRPPPRPGMTRSKGLRDRT